MSPVRMIWLMMEKRALTATRVAVGGVVAVLVTACPAAGAALVAAGGCTLPNAVTAAETDAVVGSCAAGSGADVIHLVEDLLLTAELPTVSTEITLRGNGFTLAMAPGSNQRIFSVSPTGSLSLNSVVLQDGLVSSLHGGAIYNDDGVLEIHDSTLQNNHSSMTAGAIYNTGTCVIEDSELDDNSAKTAGAIYNIGTLTIKRSTFSRNMAHTTNFDGGGAIDHRAPGSLAVTDSLFQENTASGVSAAFGGALSLSGSHTIRRVTFDRNTASGGSLARGGAVYDISSAIDIANSTFSGNRLISPVSGGGGALYLQTTGVGDVRSSTFADNEIMDATTADGHAIHLNTAGSGATTLEEVILSGASPQCVGPDLIDGGGNFGCLGAPPVSNLDSVLADNGGLTPTHALLAGSNAIDAAGPCGAFETDQRIAVRTGTCDSGAFELSGCPDDRYEVEGVPFNLGSPDVGDNQCLGAPVTVSGSTQSHRLCNFDWLFFNTSGAGTYRVETRNLQGGADTLIRASSGCSGFFAADDNSGTGAASLLEFAGTGDLVAIRTDDASGTYGPAKGYDIAVVCLSGCSCSAPDGAVLDLTSEFITSPRVFQVCDAISAGGSVTVQSGGTMLLAAGGGVALDDGFTVADGGRLAVVVDGGLAADLQP